MRIKETLLDWSSLCAGAVAIRDGSVFSDISRSVFLVGPECSGNESSLTQCRRSLDPVCITQGGVGVICQGNITFNLSLSS